MRSIFNQQLELGVTPIGEVKINRKSRHELPPLLLGLQEIFVTPEINKKVFEILEKQIDCNTRRGRPGMYLWEIFVLGMVRLNLNIDYDNLCDLSNEHRSLRGILGVLGFSKEKEYQLQTIKDNISLFDESMLKSINEVIVNHCIRVRKKKEGSVINLCSKVDSFVLESTVHFPTDLNLLKDSLLCSVHKIDKIRKHLGKGWRLIKTWQKKVRNIYRYSSEIHRKKGANYEYRLKESVSNYLKISRGFLKKVNENYESIQKLKGSGNLTKKEEKDIVQLDWYILMIIKHIDLLERRVLKGEKIPHKEKLFSIHEPHVEWINKGKYPKQVELGHNVCIVSNQEQFITNWKVYEKTTDVQQTQIIAEELIAGYESEEIVFKSISYDRGFYSLLSKTNLEEKFEKVVLPKKGKLSAKEKEEIKEDKEYQKYKSKHSTVEANISHLHKFGLDKCPDKGISNFKRYVGMAVLSYNITKLGRMVIGNDRTISNRKRA